MDHIHVSVLILYGFSLTTVMLVSLPASVVIHPGYNITLQCTNILKAPGHVAWFKQVNESEPLCIMSMYSTKPFTRHHNSAHPSHMEMFIRDGTIFLKITEVDIADSGRYFCGLYESYFIFTNVTYLKVIDNGEEPVELQEGKDDDKDGLTDLFSLVVILVGVTAVLLIVILILVIKIRLNTTSLNTTRLNTETECQLSPHNVQDQHPDSLNYASLNFNSKKKKMDRKREKLLEPNVVYAATR
ncbi:hypothetical protein UPYG_G00239330 [Umbra pygmaea]|uniref:Ig-like domain-containing protein n=1 Tax=Umbra pygmaea TaxID=75934 RepID=A0ABD0WK04_UMBPY